VRRDVLCGRLDDLLADMHDGRSSALVISGEAGIGKTTLLEYAVGRAAGAQVVSTRGVQSESAIAYAGLSDLLHPLLPLLDQLPEPQAAALSSALAIGPPVAVDQFPVCAATLGMLLAAAAAGPLVVAVDDVQWVDAPSTEALLFTLRRLRADPIVLLLTCRSGPGEADPPAGVPVLDVPGFEEADAAELLAGEGHRLDPGQLSWLVRATGGNPLALLELPRFLSPAELARGPTAAEPVPVGSMLSAAYGRHVTTLPPGTRRALLMAALLDGADLAVMQAALAGAGLDVADLTPAEDAALVELRPDAVVFRHPLVRSAVAQAATAGERRAAHRAAALALQPSPRPHDREACAWHFAAATVGVDESAGQLLDKCAEGAVARGGYWSGCLAYERAAAMTADPARRAARLLAGASAALTAGLPERSSNLLDRAIEALHSPSPEPTEIIQVRGRLDTWHGQPLAAARRLEREALRVRDSNPAKAAQLLADSTVAAMVAGNMHQALASALPAAAIWEKAGSQSGVAGQLLVGAVQAMRGEGQLSLPGFHAARHALDVPDLPAALLPQLVYLAASYLIVDELAEAEKLFDRSIAAARYSGAIGLLPFALARAAMVDFKGGHWDEAYAGASEALELAEDAVRNTEMPQALAVLALIEACQGKPEARARAAATISSAAGAGLRSVEAQGHSALGMVELGAGHSEEALGHFRRCGDMAQELGLLELGFLPWAPELVECLARSGSPKAAAPVIAMLVEHADRRQTSFLSALAARCRGLVADSGEMDACFTAALRWHGRDVPRPFELARTQLSFGERLRRSRRRRDARVHLQEAWTTFSRLGARPWAERAAAELGATGISVGGADSHATDLLTSQELHVALRISKGASNREAAEALFLSQKTVEFHLGRIYRKLGLTSRQELSGLLLERQREEDASR
jgi:DNA-binding NarL/FixJ family response regulator